MNVVIYLYSSTWMCIPDSRWCLKQFRQGGCKACIIISHFVTGMRPPVTTKHGDSIKKFDNELMCIPDAPWCWNIYLHLPQKLAKCR